MMEMLARARLATGAPHLAKALGDPDRSPMALTFRAALLLLAAREIGQNVDRLAARTGTTRSFVGRCARRLLDHGVWADGETVCEWGDEGPAHPSFWNDVAVAEGKMCRRVDESGAFEWAPVGDWIKYYEYRDPSQPSGAHYVPHPRGVPAAPVEWERAGGEEDSTAATEPEPAPLVAVRLTATLPRDLPIAQPAAVESPAPAPERPRPRTLADDPVGRLFPDAQWMG
ncbi:MAG: hypothetical protein AB1941_21370 [Gemmatimonadota bacterium]